MTISAFSVAYVIRTHPPPKHINSLPAQPLAFFLGYPTNYRGYCFLDLTTGNTIFSRHVTFDEHTIPYHKPNRPPSSHFFLEPSPLLFDPHTFPTPSSVPTPSDSPTHPSPHRPNILSDLSNPNIPTSSPILIEPTPSAPITSSAQNNPQPPTATHPMKMWARSRIFKPRQPLSLNSKTSSPFSSLPKSHLTSLSDPNWKPAMYNEY